MRSVLSSPSILPTNATALITTRTGVSTAWEAAPTGPNMKFFHCLAMSLVCLSSSSWTALASTHRIIGSWYAAPFAYTMSLKSKSLAGPQVSKGSEWIWDQLLPIQWTFASMSRALVSMNIQDKEVHSHLYCGRWSKFHNLRDLEIAAWGCQEHCCSSES